MNLPSPAPRRDWPRRLITTLVTLVVLAVAAGTFVLSYPGVHAIAVKAGVSPELARLYPGLFDALLVIACVAAVMLRDAAWWARCWAWVVIVAVLAAIGATDSAHAMNYTLPHRETEGVVAAAPAAAVLLAFSLLLTLLRYSRPHAAGTSRAARRAARQAASEPSAAPDAAIPVAAGATPRQPAPPMALPAAEPAAPTPGPADSAETPETAETAETPETPETPETAETAGTGEEPAPASPSPDSTSPASTADSAPGEEPALVTAPAIPVRQDYWDADDDRQFAGQVYPAMVAEPGDQDASPGREAGAEDGSAAGRGRRSGPAKTDAIDEDAPPFATAPFAAVPRLNRNTRITPTPPNDEATG